MRKKTSTYSEKLRDPRWQKMRLEILNRDEWMCQICFDSESTLHVHHRYYSKGAEPWEYPAEALVTLCEMCHEMETDSWREYEALLLHEFKRLFFADDLREIASGMHFAKQSSGASCYFATAIAEVFRDPEIQSAAFDKYMARIRKVKAAKEAACESAK